MNSKELFEILVREHADSLTLFLRCAVRDAALVDDLFQETMLTAWKNLDKYDKTRPFGPWLRGIAGKLVLAQRRKSARNHVLCDAQVLEHLQTRHSDLHHLPGDTLDEKLDTLRHCIERLPERYREPIELRYREELDGEQLAARLAVSMETLKKRLQRGRARLLDCLDRKLAPLRAHT